LEIVKYLIEKELKSMKLLSCSRTA